MNAIRRQQDHYLLPDGPIAIQFSGGRTSGYMLRHILDRYNDALPQNCHVLFQNTGREMPETLDFVRDCGAYWNVPIIWIEFDVDEKYRIVSHNSAARSGEPFEALIRKKRFLPNRVARFCTSDLKVRPARDWMRDQGYDYWTAVLGLRADEPTRVENAAKPMKERWQCITPLARAGVTKTDVSNFWSAQPFDLRLPNINGKTPLGNCDGCFLKSEANRAFLARYFPDRANWWARMEQINASTFHPEQHWQPLIDGVQRQPDWVFDEDNGFYCNTGFGGCHD